MVYQTMNTPALTATGLTTPNTTHGGINEDGFWTHPDGWAACVIDGLAGHGGLQYPAQWTTAYLTETANVAACPQTAAAAHSWALKTVEGAREHLLSQRADSDYPNASCALMLAVVADGIVTIAWTGDCRAYMIRSGKLARLSWDHDILYAECMRGLLSPNMAHRARAAVEEAETASQAWHAGGSHAKRLFKKQHLMTSELSSGDISSQQSAFTGNDCLLLTSDGIHDNLRFRHIQETADRARDNETELVHELLTATQNYIAGDNGHDDDLTAVTIMPAAAVR